MLNEVDGLRTARDGLWSDIRASLETRLADIATDVEGYRALDRSLDGALCVEQFIRRSREAHADAIRRKEAFEARSEVERNVRKKYLETAQEYERKAESLGAELLAAEESLRTFDPEFLAVKKLIDGLPEGTSREDLRSPPLMARFFETPLAVASKHLLRYEARTGRTFEDVLKDEYQPLVDKVDDLKGDISLAMTTARYAREECEGGREDDFRFPFGGRDDLSRVIRKNGQEFKLLHERRKVELDLEVAGRVLDDLDATCRRAVVDGIRIMVESFDHRVRSAGRPVRSDDLDALVRAGLLEPADLTTIVRRAGIGAVLDLAEDRLSRHARTARDIERAFSLARRGMDDGVLRINLDVDGLEADAGARRDDAIREDARRVRSEASPSFPEGTDMAAMQDAVLRWATEATRRTRGILLGDVPDPVGEPADVHPSP